MVMDGATARAMDSVTATQWQQKAQWQCKGYDGDGQCNGKCNRRHNSNATAMTVMDGMMATVMDGATAMQRQWKAQRQRNSNNSNGRCDGYSDGQHNGDATATTEMDGAMAMAMDGTTGTQRQWKAQQQCNSDETAMEGATA